jgi:gliding motility-associated-like protein
MRKILFLCVFLHSISWGQLPKWIQSSPCVNDYNQQLPASTNNLHFYEVDFTGSSPVFTQRNTGISINTIFTSGITELINNGVDANGDISFYVFSESITPFSPTAETYIYFAAFDPATGEDEIFGSIQGNPTNASSVRNIEVVPKPGSPNCYYVIYKSACINNLLPDEIRYVTVDMNNRTVSVSFLLSSGNQNEGMAITKLDCVTNQRWLFFSKYVSNVLQIYRCAITSTGILSPVLAFNFGLNVTSLGQGDMELSHDGTKMAIAGMATNANAIQDVLLFDLNYINGSLSNYRWIDAPNNYIASVEFSPDNQRLYLAQTGASTIQNEIYNVPVQSTNYTINPATDKIPVTMSPGGISFEIAYDQKLYFNSSGSISRLSFISNPNSNAAGNSVSQTPVNSYGIGNRSGNSFPDQIDGEFYSQNVFVTASMDTICPGQSVTLSASGASDYSWSNGLTGNGEFQIVSPAVTTTYIVSSSGICGSGADSIEIVVIADPVAQINGMGEICEGDSLVLTGSGGTSFFWNGSTVPGPNTIIVTPHANTNYSLVVANGACIGSVVTFGVNVHSNPELEISGDTVYCEGQTAILYANLLSGAAPFSYVWSDSSVTAVNSFVPATGQDLGLIVVDQFGCSDTASVHIEIEPLPQANFLVDETGCAPLEITIQNESANATGFSWNFGDGSNNSSTVTGKHTYSNSGIYSVTLIAKNTLGCADTLTLTDAVEVLNTPYAAFSAYESDPSNPTTVIFTDHSFGSDSCFLDFGDSTSILDCDWNRLIHGYEQEGTYTITQVLTNTSSGCKDSTVVVLRIYGETIFYVPNTFTPDGNEHNNTFSVIMPENTVFNEFELMIYNRWGDLVFQSNDLYTGWDGTYDGQPSQVGTYTWKLHLEDDRTEKEYTGHITLLK